MVSKFSSRLKPKFRNLVLDEDATYFESAIYALFRIDVVDFISLKAQLSKAFHIQPSEIDRMPYWEFELYIKELERLTKEEKDQQEEEMKKSGAKDAMKMAKPGYMQKMMQSSQPKMPKIPNMNMPSTISMPSYKI